MKQLFTIYSSVLFMMGCGGDGTEIPADTSNLGFDVVMPDNVTSIDETTGATTRATTITGTAEPTNILNPDDMFSNRDSNTEYDLSTAIAIELSSTQTINIVDAGTYILSGTIDNGQIIIDVDKDVDKVQLVLDDVNITSKTSAPIYVKSADKVFVTLAENSVNTLTVSGEYVSDGINNVDGVIFSKNDITFNGLGTLTINANYGNGIVGKDDVVFTSGIYNITSAKHGIDANDSVRVKDGTLNIVSSSDGIHVDDEDVDKGYFYMADGELNINSEQDGISTSGSLQIDNGELNIVSGGGFVEVLNIITVGEGRGNAVLATDSLEHSMQSIKGGNIVINNGIFNLSSYEDTIHSNSDLVINGGNIYILSGDDAVHADDLLTINYVDLDVVEAYEGLEGSSITINGGNIKLNVLDDAVNSSSNDGALTINGSDIYLSAQGDGLDSNGSFIMTGGDIVLNVTPVYAGGDGNVDVSGEITFTGGTIKDVNGNDIDPTAQSQGGRGGMGGGGNRREQQEMTPEMLEQMQNMPEMQMQQRPMTEMTPEMLEQMQNMPEMQMQQRPMTEMTPEMLEQMQNMPEMQMQQRPR